MHGDTCPFITHACMSTTKNGLFYQVLLQVVITSLLVVYHVHVLSKVKQQFPLRIPLQTFPSMNIIILIVFIPYVTTITLFMSSHAAILNR